MKKTLVVLMLLGVLLPSAVMAACSQPPTCSDNQASKWNGSSWDCIDIGVRIKTGSVSHGGTTPNSSSGCGEYDDSFDVGFQIVGAFAAPASDSWTGSWHMSAAGISWSGSVVQIHTSVIGGICDARSINWIAFGN